jgi:ubiquinone/menaquinone biosynthesis C-methylase UbiE
VDSDFIDKKEFTILDLLKLNGHISDTGGYDIKLWEKLVHEINSYSNIDQISNSKILEIGCGSGALLVYFNNNNNLIFGLDSSDTLLSVAKKVISNGIFFNGEAKLLPYDNDFFDLILSHSCFQYFPNNVYMMKVIDEATRTLKSGGRMVLTDLCDAEKEEKYMLYRKKILGYKKYTKLYTGEKNTNLYHLHIHKNQITDSLEKKFSNITIDNAFKRGDEDDYFRFNLFCTKK